MAIRHHPDLILADLQMDQMNGVEMTKALVADSRDQQTSPSLLFRPSRAWTTIAVLEEAGIKAHVPKPFTPELIHKVVRSVLGGAHA